MEVLVLTIVFVVSFLSIIKYINKTIKEGDACKCGSSSHGCHKIKGAASHGDCH
jgi:hypothetical protein